MYNSPEEFEKAVLSFCKEVDIQPLFDSYVEQPCCQSKILTAHTNIVERIRTLWNDEPEEVKAIIAGVRQRYLTDITLEQFIQYVRITSNCEMFKAFMPFLDLQEDQSGDYASHAKEIIHTSINEFLDEDIDATYLEDILSKTVHFILSGIENQFRIKYLQANMKNLLEAIGDDVIIAIVMGNEEGE